MGLVLVEVGELALADLLSDNVHVVRLIELLEGFDREPWKQAYEHHEQCLKPERKLPVNLRGGFVKVL